MSQDMWPRYIGIAILSSIATAVIMWNGYKKDDKPKSSKLNNGFSEEIINEQLARNRAFFGEQGLKTIRSSVVYIVGAGGVGSWAATMLVRSGVKKIKLIDFDQVTLSSLNRHATATLADVGTSKVMSMKRRFMEIAPWVEVEAVNELWTLDKADKLLAGDPAFVIDVILSMSNTGD